MGALLVASGLAPAWPIYRRDPAVLADPLKYVLHQWGLLACVLLATVLSFSPLRVLFPQVVAVHVLNRHRRLVGVSAGIYAALHFSAHLAYEGGGVVLASDVQKPFLLAGLAAFAILLVLALTSLRFFVRRLGPARWKNLHRLAYPAAALVAYHQAAARKTFPPTVLWIFVPLAILELARVAWSRRASRGSG